MEYGEKVLIVLVCWWWMFSITKGQELLLNAFPKLKVVRISPEDQSTLRARHSMHRSHWPPLIVGSLTSYLLHCVMLRLEVAFMVEHSVEDNAYNIPETRIMWSQYHEKP